VAGITASECREPMCPESSRREPFIRTASGSSGDVHHPEKTVVIDLHDQRFNELVVEVDDPEAAVKPIQNAL